MRRDFKQDTWEKFNEAAKGRDVYLFGAGNLGRELLKKCKNYNSGWNIKGFLDNDKSKFGTNIDGLQVFGVAELSKSENYVVLICTMYPGTIANQLDALGIENYWSSIWMDDTMHDFLIQEDIDALEINRLKEILYDEKSKNLLDALVQKRKAGFMDYTDIQDSGTEYFIDEFFTKDSNEVFIDCGAYDGDTIDEFCSWTENQFKAVYSFEPDAVILQKIKSNMHKYDQRIHLIPKGVYSHKTTLSFMNTNAVYSGHVVENTGNMGGLGTIECVSLDEEIQEKVTFIKMDIEGSEIPALNGAKNIILRDKPKLAICIYHKPDDLWKIPLMLKDWVPEYRMHLRHYGRRYYGTVLYAYIP